MNMHISLNWWRAVPARPAARVAAPDWVNATLDTATHEPEAVVAACGWFDSSHELHTGLQVTEHLTPERVVNEVPLGWWLDWQSHPGWQARPGMQPPARAAAG
ncbi:MAG: hypothetical protein ACRC2B_13010 [Rubrivivax sp.]